MKLIEALEILGSADGEDCDRFAVSLVCGIEPLHLRTFLAAELTRALPGHHVEVATGLFDDLPGNLERAAAASTDALAVVIEWTDIDPRLGLRRLGGWRSSELPDLVRAAELQLARLEGALLSAARAAPLVYCPPTLPLPPLFAPRLEQSGADELALRSALAASIARLAADERISVASMQALDERSPAALRRDPTTELAVGFPYSLAHASAVGELLAALIAPSPPKKGLITDLDDTLWAGSLGEDAAVTWSAESQMHGLYQQLLASLASAGVLIGVATRNDPELVARMLERRDLLIDGDAVYPIEARWGPKSDSIAAVLRAWNVAAADVVFVDDSPLDLDEARSAHPGLETIRFPAGDPSSLWELMARLRELFGKPAVTADDGLRLDSLRAAASMPTERTDEFLAQVDGRIAFRDDRARALELFNKTNQFNLNGRRLTEAAFDRSLDSGESQLITVGYEDMYGPLGTVAALLVRPAREHVAIDAWVMSCRAFSRRIEHHCLDRLFARFGVELVTADYRGTDRNAPMRAFLSELLGETPGERVSITRREFLDRSPALVHRVSA